LALVRTLPPDQAEVILLRVVAGMDNTQVAGLLGKTPGAVRVLSHRGLRRLATLVTEQMMAGGVER
jgi:RNA polymerase sigma-70 factor (ECF subfamily)